MNPNTTPPRAYFPATPYTPPAPSVYAPLKVAAVRYSTNWSAVTTPGSLAKFHLAILAGAHTAGAASSVTRYAAVKAAADAAGRTDQLRVGYNNLMSIYRPDNGPGGSDYGPHGNPGDKVHAENWYLRKSSGFPSGDTINMFGSTNRFDTNYSLNVPADSNGKRYPQVYAEICDYVYRRDGIGAYVGGYFLDNSGWYSETTGDWAANGGGDIGPADAAARGYMAAGHRAFWDRLRELDPTRKLILNSTRGAYQNEWFDHASITGQADGNMCEWVMHSYVAGAKSNSLKTAGFSQADSGSANSVREKFAKHVADGAEWTLLHVGVSSASDYAMARFGMCAAWILGGQPWITISTGVNDNGFDPPWYDEYDAPLGEPIDAVPTAKVVGTTNVWMRRYQNGVLILNGASSVSGTHGDWGRHPGSAATIDNTVIPYGVYKRITGSQDPVRNSGAVVSGSFSLPAWDGIVLLCVTPEVHS